ncbi:hypothetical protein, partial [Citrobacter freundii]|uniref:hypothetical protein n=1 Tax=Citrobacter freundii TaxID=546 RepID=UPI0021C9CFC2
YCILIVDKSIPTKKIKIYKRILLIVSLLQPLGNKRYKNIPITTIVIAIKHSLIGLKISDKDFLWIFIFLTLLNKKIKVTKVIIVE